MALPDTTSLPQNASIVSRWKLDEASGTRADSVGSNTLTDNNTVASGTGNNSTTCADFESANSEYLSITDAAQTGLDITTDFSFGLWINPESITGTHRLFMKWTTLGNRSYHLTLNSDGTIGIGWRGATGNTTGTSTATVSTGTWTHVMGRVDLSEAQAYLQFNDSAMETLAMTGSDTTINNGNATFAVGSNSTGGEYYDGLMEDLVIWNVLLTEAELDDYYAAYSATETGLLTLNSKYW